MRVTLESRNDLDPREERCDRKTPEHVAGAMLFVISHEIIPESHCSGHEGKATFGVLLGFVVMLTIDLVLD